MAEILVKAVDVVHADAEKDRRGTHKKGDIIVVMPDGHLWGTREGPPKFVVVRCPQVTVDQVRDRIEAWPWSISFTVDSSNGPQDRHRITARNTTQSASGQAALTLARVEAFLTRWGASIVSSTVGSVTFDTVIRTAAMSAGFWDTDVSSFAFVEDSYNSSTGVHQITATYSSDPRYTADPVRFDRAVRAAVEHRGTLIVQNTGIITYAVTRGNVREQFRADVAERLGNWRRHRYYFDPDDVDIALAQGGAIDVTAAQLSTRLRDRVAE